MGIYNGILNEAASYWWALLLRGIVGILFGILALTSPGIGLLALAITFGFYQLLEGGLAAYLAFSLKEYWLLLAGALGILVGVLAFASPMFTSLVLLYFVAVWAVVMGVVQLYESIANRKEGGFDWLLFLAGAAGILLGVMLFSHPAAGLLTLALYVGVYALVSGIAYIIMSLNLHGFRNGHHRTAAV